MESPQKSDNVFIRRCYRKDVRSLSFSYIETPEKLIALENFIKSELISELHIIQVTRIVLEYILKIFINNPSKLVTLEIKTVALSWDDNTIALLNKFFDINNDNLKNLILRCYLKAKFIASILEHVPLGIESLDLSENIFDVENHYLNPLIQFIGSSELIELKLSNTSMTKASICNFFSKLGDLDKPIALRNIHGIEVSNVMLSNEVNKINGINKLKFTKNSDFLNHIRDVYFLKLMVNHRIRVWWPSTTTEAKTLYSGRYWPAKVLKVNTIDKILVVKYDNDEIDHPLSPFKFGGGFNDDLLENTFFIKKDVDSIVDLNGKRRPLIDFIESDWDIDESLAGNLITVGELCEFRDPRDIDSTDPSDFVGYLKELKPNEPIYLCKCIYQDDEYSDVSSCNIRRAAVVKWENWVYKTTKAHRLLNKINSINQLHSLMESVWVYPKFITSESKLASGPSIMRVNTLVKHRRAISYDLRNHPGLKRLDGIKFIDNLDRNELIKKCKSYYNELINANAKLNIFDFLQNECQELRVQVDKYESKIHELESQLLCFICTKSKINCIIHPCGHFQICDMCANAMGKCPSCTNQITSIQLVKFSLC